LSIYKSFLLIAFAKSIKGEELQEMIDEADLNGDGEVSKEEFLNLIKKTNLI